MEIAIAILFFFLQNTNRDKNMKKGGELKPNILFKSTALVLILCVFAQLVLVRERWGEVGQDK